MYLLEALAPSRLGHLMLVHLVVEAWVEPHEDHLQVAL